MGLGECLYVGDGADRELSAAAGIEMQPVLPRVPYDDPKEWDRVEAAEWEGETVSALRDVLSWVEQAPRGRIARPLSVEGIDGSGTGERVWASDGSGGLGEDR